LAYLHRVLNKAQWFTSLHRFITFN
jgi:hypothetical protein